MRELIKLIRKNNVEGMKTFVYFQYGGHGVIDETGNTEALCNVEVSSSIEDSE